MEQKKISLSLIFCAIIFAIGVAIKSICTYLSGFGLLFVAVLSLFMLVLYFAISSVEVRKRVIDVLILSAISTALISIQFCVYEWALELTESLYDFTRVFCNVISVFSLLFLVYALIRIMTELSGKKLKVVEIILGERKVKSTNKVSRENRQPKEVMNGDLEQKPIAERREYSIPQYQQDVQPSNNVEESNNVQPINNDEVAGQEQDNNNNN